jgi:hypothetical protein
MNKQKTPLQYAEQIVDLLAGADEPTGRIALKLAPPLLDYRHLTSRNEGAAMGDVSAE